ncbi:MAG: type II toxin-antitoxin system RelB/DinJ family antitoxin [Oscillospiraceae bacterium]|nr:type II toxin-antitoxin system RelB/DinJ family antitoxin [Oscillospiraceae bacterium]
MHGIEYIIMRIAQQLYTQDKKDVVILATTNITVRVDVETKSDFDTFCENVGINATAAVNMFIKAVLRTRELPFTVTDINYQEKNLVKARAVNSINNMRDLSIRNGNSELTLAEINAEIEAARKEVVKKQC